MHDARAIANFFIDRSVEKSRPVSAMTLLKVLYFAHAWHLAKLGEPLVAQPFEAWKNGPVVRVVYDQIKAKGAKPVTSFLKSFDPSLKKFSATQYSFKPDLVEFLANIFDFYAMFHPFDLSDLTHEKGSPWDLVWSRAERGAIPGMVIPDDQIKLWFLESGPQHLKSAKQRYAI